MHPEKIKNVFNLPPEERYDYFIRKVADFEEVWLVKKEQNIIALVDESEREAISVFPEKGFAELLLQGEWEGFTVEKIDVYDFVDWLDQIKKEGKRIACFPKDDFIAFIVSAEEMKVDLLEEIKQYK